MVQTRKTGSTISCLWPTLLDHARMPVMLPRTSDSDMCRDGSNAALMQPENAVDEHGGVHGVPDLEYWKDLRRPAWKIVTFTAMEGEWRWRRLQEKQAQLGGQDKSTAVGLGTCGWFGSTICDGAKIGVLALEAKRYVKSTINTPSHGIWHVLVIMEWRSGDHTLPLFLRWRFHVCVKLTALPFVRSATAPAG